MKISCTWLLALGVLLCTTSASSFDKRATLSECLKSHEVPLYEEDTKNYTQAVKPFNLRLPFAPASYAVPTTVKHVQDAVSCGVSSGIRVTAKCGGHSYGAHGLGGEDGHLIIDMRRFNSVTVGQEAHTAVVGAGGRLGNIALALYNQGKQAISHGTCPGVGVSGLTLHGGYGLSSRLHGLTLDAMISATVVLSNSSIVTASKTSNPDLFWALRGAGAAFGIVTDFTFSTFTAPEDNLVFSYDLSPSNTTQLTAMLSALQNFTMHDQPPELNMRMFLPRQLTGVYYGNRSTYDTIMAPLLRELNIPSSGRGSGTVSSKTWLNTLTSFSNGPLAQPEIYTYHENFYAKSLMTPALSEKALHALADYYFTTARNLRGRSWYLLIDMHGGAGSAISAVGADETAYVHRDAVFKMQFNDRIFPDSATYTREMMGFLNGWVGAVEQASGEKRFGMYINYADTNLTSAEAHARYWGSNYERLEGVKGVWDPKGVFEGPQLVGS
ncbi:glucooligosaccharide oxidase [Stemphylium lycopersici]|uniref:Glucooligosaccharide oxidase n=1 Tax=Stemphylium lycopersici TaxID=183478 RepID=A0A364NCN2_STELY|nr:glucooligosaccharide oxidase [Stemphylium lycopersici]RAR15088.1 glucooligosaccharide oxidase [Stemphylium lycopersici]